MHIKEVAKQKLTLMIYFVIGLVLIVYSSMALIFHLIGGEPPYTFLFSYVIVELVMITLGGLFIYDTIKRRQTIRAINQQYTNSLETYCHLTYTRFF